MKRYFNEKLKDYPVKEIQIPRETNKDRIVRFITVPEKEICEVLKIDQIYCISSLRNPALIVGALTKSDTKTIHIIDRNNCEFRLVLRTVIGIYSTVVDNLVIEVKHESIKMLK